VVALKTSGLSLDQVYSNGRGVHTGTDIALVLLTTLPTYACKCTVPHKWHTLLPWKKWTNSRGKEHRTTQITMNVCEVWYPPISLISSSCRWTQKQWKVGWLVKF